VFENKLMVFPWAFHALHFGVTFIYSIMKLVSFKDWLNWEELIFSPSFNLHFVILMILCRLNTSSPLEFLSPYKQEAQIIPSGYIHWMY